MLSYPAYSTKFLRTNKTFIAVFMNFFFWFWTANYICLNGSYQCSTKHMMLPIFIEFNVPRICLDRHVANMRKRLKNYSMRKHVEIHMLLNLYYIARTASPLYLAPWLAYKQIPFSFFDRKAVLFFVYSCTVHFFVFSCTVHSECNTLFVCVHTCCSGNNLTGRE